MQRAIRALSALSAASAAFCPPSAPPALTVRFGRDAPPRPLTLEELPLRAPDGAALAVTVCNWGNAAEAGAQGRLPRGLVGAVGSGAEVRVDVAGSFNLALAGGDLVLLGAGRGGAPTARALRHGVLALASPEGALIPSLVAGPIGEAAAVRVSVRASGCVSLPGALRVEGRALLAPPVLARGRGLVGASVEVDVADSGNVAGGALLVGDHGALVGALVECSSATGSSVQARARNVSNVDVAALHVSEGGLMGSAFHCDGAVRNTSATVELRGVGRVWGGGVEVDRGELVGEAVDAEAGLERATVQVDAAHVGDIEATGSVAVSSTEMLDEVVDTKDISASSVRVRLRDVGNVRAGGHVAVTKAELLDEVVDCSDIRNSSVDVSEADVGNVAAPSLHLVKGSLVDEAVDAKAISGSTLRVIMASVASFDGGSLRMEDSELADEAIDAKVAGGSLVVALSHVGRRSDAGGEASDRGVLEKMIDADAPASLAANRTSRLSRALRGRASAAR